MNRSEYLKLPPYSLTEKEKTEYFRRELPALSAGHRAGCAPYRMLCEAFGSDTPRLPVSAFRDETLISVPRDEIVRELSSSGTSGQKPSRIFLDNEASTLQQYTLLQIMQDYLGRDRMPMLIIDSKKAVRTSGAYNAHRAGIAGFSLLSSSRTWALNDQMDPDLERIMEFAEAHRGERILIFGFTYMIRQYFTLPLLKAGLKPDFPRAIVVHGGGWKKMEALSVSPERFAEELREAAGIQRVINYYGMTEQLGSIFMECECGHLHAPIYTQVETLRPEDFSVCEKGEPGVIALRSMLPTSYPGHSILTEDLGLVLGDDDCPCGRKGRYFRILGRMPKAEIRGCSDTMPTAGSRVSESPAEPMQVRAGTFPPANETLPAFSPAVTDSLARLSGLLLHDPECRSYPELAAFGFWLRQAHLEQLKERYPEPLSGAGHVLIIPAGNMPLLFAYNWASAMLSGCSCTVRLPEHLWPSDQVLLRRLQDFFAIPGEDSLQRRSAFVQFSRSDQRIQSLSADADIRIFWGSDSTVARLSAIPGKPSGKDLLFPNRYSAALLSAPALAKLPQEELRLLCDRFYRDTYAADQNACSSPKLIFWLTSDPSDPEASGLTEAELEETRSRWQHALTEIVQKYWQPEAATLLSKYSCAVRIGMRVPGVRVYSRKDFGEEPYPGKDPEEECIGKDCLDKDCSEFGNTMSNLKNDSGHITYDNYLITADLSGAVLPGCETGSGSPDESGMGIIPSHASGSLCKDLLSDPDLSPFAGLFYELPIASLADLPADLGDGLQTVTAWGVDPDGLRAALERSRTYEALRIAAPGEALTFDPVWDGKDLIRLLSRES